MNPGDVAQSVLPLTSSDLSLFTLFWQAHFVVKAVMIGLLISSVWVWAIVIDKTILYARTRAPDGSFRTGVLVGRESLKTSIAICRPSPRMRCRRSSSPRCASGSAPMKAAAKRSSR